MLHTKIAVLGVGWITKNQYGSVNRKLHRDYDDSESLHSRLHKEAVFVHHIKNFRRFDPVSKMTCCAAALALHDAHMTYSRDQKQDIGIIGTNETGCFQSNLRYFRDYIRSGRTLGRGILFVYTLPSIPLAEAAIQFGFQGPLLYIDAPDERMPTLISTASAMILRNETSAVLALNVDEEEAVCYFFGREDGHDKTRMLSLENLMCITGNTSNTAEVIRELSKE